MRGLERRIRRTYRKDKPPILAIVQRKQIFVVLNDVPDFDFEVMEGER